MARDPRRSPDETRVVRSSSVLARRFCEGKFFVTPFSIAILSFSMTADSFAAALARGAIERPSLFRSFGVAIVFAVVQAIMPVLGWGAGYAAGRYIESTDHWIAFLLLAGVGVHMLMESMQHPDSCETPRTFSAWAVFATAVGTSIDAAAVGVSLAFFDTTIGVIAASIGAATFLMVAIGLAAGRAIGTKWGAVAEAVGGLVLIVLGTKILAEHLGFIIL
jgi:putative Mn2+ efflux pump MntP